MKQILDWIMDNANLIFLGFWLFVIVLIFVLALSAR